MPEYATRFFSEECLPSRHCRRSTSRCKGNYINCTIYKIWNKTLNQQKTFWSLMLSIGHEYNRIYITSGTQIFILYNPPRDRNLWSVYRSNPTFYSPQFQDQDLNRVLSNSFFFTDEEIAAIENYILVQIICPLLFGAHEPHPCVPPKASR